MSALQRMRHYPDTVPMKANAKKVLVWSSLGSIALGTVVALARRPRTAGYGPVSCRRIPRGCQALHLWTERLEITEGGVRQYAHDRYFVQPTHFRLWSVLDLSLRGTTGKTATEGAAIFHITHMRSLENSFSGQPEELMLDRFYGILTVLDPASNRACGINEIARGAILEVRKCYVGGTSNGVESGETHRSVGRILNYRIDMPLA